MVQQQQQQQQQYDDDATTVDEARVTKSKQVVNYCTEAVCDGDSDGSPSSEPQLRDVTQDGVYRSERDHGFLLCCTTATVEVHSSRLHLQHSQCMQ